MEKILTHVFPTPVARMTNNGTDRLLVISGASRGIGLATAKLFKKEGFRVINISRTSIDTSIGDHLDADLSDPRWKDKSENSLKELIGAPDQIVLIHNASLLLKDNLKNASVAFGLAMQINVLASQQLNEIVLSHMNSGSSIHYLGSTLSEKAVANTLTYSTTKHATLGLMRATCQDLLNTGIHTTCVCPGFTDTEMLREHLGEDQAVYESIAAANGFKRLVDPEEIAATLLFAANTPVLNGAVLHANLGQKEY